MGKIKTGRPDLNLIFSELRDYANELGESKVGVMCCGPPRMIDSIYKKTHEFSREFNVKDKKKIKLNQNNTELINLNTSKQTPKVNTKVPKKSQKKKGRSKVVFDFHCELFDF